MQSNFGILILLLNTVLKAEEKTQPHKTVILAEHKFNETSCLSQKDCEFSQLENIRHDTQKPQGNC